MRTTATGRSTRHLGIPLAGAARMVVDLSDVYSRHRLTNVMYELERRDLLRRAEIERMADRLARGHNVSRIRFALRRRKLGHLGSMSALEERAIRALSVREQRPSAVNPPITTDIGVLYVDLVWRAPRVCVEIDGDHGSAEQQLRDRARDAALRRAGWTVLRFDADDVSLRADQMARSIAAARHVRQKAR
ncbi:MAG: DUF559 domain-containing protein [Thermoleophilia bacterium]|nr:DUF559 domain-containing protein [Thermoleophilia bacterium]